MSHIAIATAKVHNTSIPNKNLIKIDGKPLLGHVIEAAGRSKNINKIFVSTDGEPISSVAKDYGATVIIKPKVFENHGDEIEFAVNEVKNLIDDEIETVTILLSNTVAANPESIDLAIEILKKSPETDSVMTVWQAQDDHPYRSMERNENGFLRSFLDIKVGTSRQTYPPVYFYDQGPWVFRPEVLGKKSGPGPWWWMGEKCFPIIRNWITGRDVHTLLDVAFTEYWFQNKHKDEIINQHEVNNILQK